jgi:hypothetical protein
LFICCIYFVFVECHHSSINETTISFDFKENTQNIEEIGLIDSVEVYSLDCKEVMFEHISKIERRDGRIYLMDNEQTHSIYVYDSLCNYVGAISRRGNGHGEYVNLTDFFIDSKEQTINLVSYYGGKVLKFDLHDLQLIRTDRLPRQFRQIVKINNVLACYVSQKDNKITDYNLYLLSNNLQINERLLPIEYDISSVSIDHFSLYQNTLYFIRGLDFNIYAIKNNEIVKSYSFDFGKLSLPSNINNENEATDYVRNGKSVSDLYFFQETNNHLIIKVLYNGQERICIYNKNNKKTYTAYLDSCTSKYFFPFGKIIGIDENAIYTLINAYNFKRTWTGKDEYNDYESQYSEQIKRMRKRFPTVDEEGNPFLVIYYIN